MKKILITTLFLAAFATTVKAQAPIPNSWNCTSVTSLPQGYTIGGPFLPSNYTSEGVSSSASVKLNGDDQYLQIELAAEAGVFTYWIKGTLPPPPPVLTFNGQFDIQISDNGSTWTTVRSLSNSSVPSTIQQFSDNVLPSTRFIRFYFTRKESGFNISLDDIVVNDHAPRSAAEILTNIDNNTVFSGGTYSASENVGSTKRINIVVNNKGLDSNLNITSVTSSNSAEFSVVSFPSAISALTSDTVKIDFSPSTQGTRTSIITINNNDSNESAYIINLIGYGDGLSTEPNTPLSVSASNVVTYDYDVTITPNSPLSGEGYLVLFKAGSAPTVAPTDGVVYSAGDMIGSAKVAYVGSGTTYSAKEVIANSTYYISVYSYGGTGTFTNYSAVAATTSATTPLTLMPGTYYNTISTSNTSFIQNLHNLINPHTLLFYSDYDDTYIENFGSRDTTNGQLVVTCRYTSDEYIYSPPFSFNYISREHSYPQSWMPTYGDEAKPEYNDYHNLFPVNQNNANGVRSNYPLGEVVTITSTFMDGTFGLDSAGNKVYEPRDSHKGDAARAIFYMCVAYTGVAGNSWALPDSLQNGPFNPPFKGQDQDVLKKWHWQDPVDNWEIARNDYIASIQGNRNPFIDSMQYACYIDFSTMTRVVTAAPCTTTPVGINEVSDVKHFSVYPNPAQSILTLQYELFSEKNVFISILDLLGKPVQEPTYSVGVSGNKTLDVSSLAKGTYFIQISTNNSKHLIKFIKN